MTEHLVVLMVGVKVTADDPEAAKRKALVPFQHGLLPNMVGIIANGARPALPTDTPELFAERLNKAMQ